MRKIALAVLVFISLAMLPTSAANAPKAGATCKKVGTTTTANGKKFTCVKSGKKLIWNKGVKVSVPRPSATPTPTAAPAPTFTPTPIESPLPTVTPTQTPTGRPFVPWSTNATGKEISDAAQKNFRDWALAQNDKPLNHVFFIQDGVFPSRAQPLTASDSTGSKLFSQFFPTKSVTVIGRNQAWVVEKLNSLGGNFKNCSISLTDGIDWCWDSQTMQGMVVYSDVKFNPRNLAGDASSLLAHEYFHLVQFQLSVGGPAHLIKNGTAATSNMFPTWFIEGSAEFVSYSVSTLAMGTDYWQARDSVNNLYGYNSDSSRNALVDAEIRTFSGTQPNGPIDPYIIGRVGTEYLVASIGFQKFLDIFKSFKETKNFERSFELVAGLKISDFYEKFEKVRTALGMPAVSMKLVCLTNTPIKDVPTVLPACEIKSTLP
jgi:hypothetical protein